MTGRNRLRSLLTLAYLNGIVPMRTQPLFLVQVLASPLSFVFFVTVASKGTLIPYAVTGGMLLTMLSIGTSLQSDLTHYRTDLKLQDVVVASPVEGPIYVAGLALSELIYSIPGLGVFAALWVTTHPGPIAWTAVPTLFFALLLVWAFASALGFTLATYFADIRETFLLSSLTSLVLTVLPPVYYPLQYLPAVVRPFAYLSPTTYAADLLHSTGVIPGFPVPSTGQLLIDWVALIAFTIGLLALAAFKARWREP